MKIVILDGYTINPGDLSWDELGKLGELTVYERTEKTVEETVRRIADAEAVFTSKVPITEEIMAQCPKLRFIGTLATGYNVIDTAAAAKRGIPVCNVPAYSTDAVAQTAFALLLELCVRTGHHNKAVQDGRWCSCKDFCFCDFPIMELSGKTMGIIGFGSIGKAVGKIARAFGMNVLAAGSRPTEEGRAIGTYVELEELLTQSDVISLHCPLFPETEHIINSSSIAKMKDGVIILNTSRGPLIDSSALADALRSGKVAGAGVDVLPQEPPARDEPLLHAPNCVITPHLAWASKEARARLIDITVHNLQQFLNGTPVNAVNL
ncbi:MAG: D-2-hydroxyacid dehydrogenase [Oscillospiraceae bacterium]|nr:D-2-hydroxyacid dehydrogenase [Oscillospiraceae bacterium]